MLKDKVYTQQIISCAFTVHKNLGKGFLEKIYENAMVIELKNNGLDVCQQFPINVIYDNKVIGDYFSDLFVENRIICELKAVDKINRQHEIQLVNYLAATGFDSGLLINFSDRVEVKRKFRTYKKTA